MPRNGFVYGGGMQEVPWWGAVSSAAAPVFMVGGWTAAADLQPRFDAVSETVSSLAAPGATDRWVMTLTFVVVGLCYVVTALALRPARTTGRLILIAGAVAGMLVAVNPEHPGDPYPWPHIICASIGLAGVATWPAGAWRRGAAVPWALRPGVAATAVAVLLALVAWFAVELVTGSSQTGLAERVAGAAQALWPLTVVLSCEVAPGRAWRMLADWGHVRGLQDGPGRRRGSLDLCASRWRWPSSGPGPRASADLGYVASSRSAPRPARLHSHLPGPSRVRPVARAGADRGSHRTFQAGGSG